MKQVSLQVLNVVMLLQEACNGVQEFSHQEIQRMIGILRTNGMKLEPHGTGTLNILFHRFSRFLKDSPNCGFFSPASKCCCGLSYLPNNKKEK